MALFDLTQNPGLMGDGGAPQGPNRLQQVLQFLGKIPAAGAGVLGTLTAGPNDPRLTDEQNRRAQQIALLQGGAATLAASPEAPGLAAFGRGALVGQQAAAEQREIQYAETQVERLRNALRDPEILSSLSPQAKKLVQVLPPEQAMQLIVESLSAQAGEPKVVGEGGALVSPSGELLFQNPGRLDSDANIKAALFSVLGPNFEQRLGELTPEQWPMIFQIAEQYRRSGAANVTVGDQFDTGLQRIALEDFQRIQSDAATAQSRLLSLMEAEALLEELGGDGTGQLQAATTALRGYAASLGLADADKLGMQQVVTAIANKLALEMKAGMTGQMSDRDILFLKMQTIQLANTPEGNRRLIEVLRRQAQIQVDLANRATQYIAEHGSLDGWFTERNRFLAEENAKVYELLTGKRPGQATAADVAEEAGRVVPDLFEGL